jgi:hypothetical protein
MTFPTLASTGAILLLLLAACNEVDSPEATPNVTVVVAAKPSSPVQAPAPQVPVTPGTAVPNNNPTPNTGTGLTTPTVPTKEKVQQPVVPTPVPTKVSQPATPTPSTGATSKAADVSLNHYCLLSDHSNLCSRTSMYQDWPGHSLKLEPMNNSGQTLTGTLIIDYDGSKIEPGTDGYLRHSVNHSTIAFTKAPGQLIIKNFSVYPGRNYHYIWSRIKNNASGTVLGKATFSWWQDNQLKYTVGCYEFKINSQGGNDNIQGIEKGKFNGFGGMDCGAPSLPE